MVIPIPRSKDNIDNSDRTPPPPVLKNYKKEMDNLCTNNINNNPGKNQHFFLTKTKILFRNQYIIQNTTYNLIKITGSENYSMVKHSTINATR